MPKDVYYATGVFEIGDTFCGEDGHLHVITDVLVCHYIGRGVYKVLYEVDQCGEFTELVLQAEPPALPPHKSMLKLVPNKCISGPDLTGEEDPTNSENTSQNINSAT